MRTFFAVMRPVGADGLLLLVVLALALKLTHDLAAVRDVPVWDECGALWSGCHLPRYGLPAAENSPLYTAWYYLLSLLQPDPPRLYYFNRSVLCFLLPASLYVLTRSAGGGRAAALLASFLVLTSSLVEIQPHTTLLATALLALGTSLAIRCRSGPRAFAVVGLTLLVAAYLRPENAVAFVLCCLAGLATAVWRLRRRPATWAGVAAPVLVLLAA